jgi:hypothetical protein
MGNPSELLNVQIGLGGSKVINDTDRHTGKWKVVTALADAVIDEYEDSKMTGSLSGITLKQGASVAGLVTVIKLTSGTVIAYE